MDQPKSSQPAEKAPSGMSRREFARRAALTALAPAALAPVAVATSMQAPAPSTSQAPAAKTPSAPPAAAQTATPAATDPNLPKLSPQGQAEVDARIQSILGQYGSRLSDSQQADIRRLCAWAQPPLDRLRAFHVQNSDGEALYLKPLVEREKKPAAPSAKPAVKKP